MIQSWIRFGIACTAAIMFVSAGVCGQTGARPSAQGTLTVTATVVTSVGVEISQDGEQRIVVANAVDPRDNVSRLRAGNEKPQDRPVFQGLKPLDIESSSSAGINAHSIPSPGSVAQGRLCATPRGR